MKISTVERLGFAAMLLLLCHCGPGRSVVSRSTPNSDAGAGVDMAMNMAADAGGEPPDAALVADRAASFDFPPTSDAFLGKSRCPPNILFCDDFEKGDAGSGGAGSGDAAPDAPPLDPTQWTMAMTGATVDVDTSQHARGGSSVHVQVTGGAAGSLGSIATVEAFAIAGSHLFVRAFYRTAGIPPSNGFSIFRAADTAAADPSTSQRYSLDLIPLSAAAGSLFAYRWSTDGKTSKQQDGAPIDQPPFGDWTCWEVELGGSTNAIHLFVNEHWIPSVDVMSWPAVTKANLLFGVWLNKASTNTRPGGFNVWIDGVAVANTRIGCSL